MKHLRICLLLIVCAVPVLAESHGLTRHDEIAGFADYLFQEGDYYRAITEYLRVLHLYPDHDYAPRYQLNIAIAYIAGQRPAAARGRLTELTTEHSQSALGAYAHLLLGLTAYMEKDFQQAALQFEVYLEMYPSGPFQDEIAALVVTSYLQDGFSHLATAFLNERAEQRPIPAELLTAVDDFSTLPRKSPRLAGTLSILPGAGQLYVGRKKDAALAFTLNAALIWATYEAFDRNQNVAGALLALIEAGWYFGNIYNAVNGAHQFNREKQQTFLYNLEVGIAPVLSPQTGFNGAMMGARFRF